MTKTLQRNSGGRPRAYDPDVALDAAAQLFWAHGYSAVSLDDIARETGMKRPSLAAAFGDKRAIYLKTLERYRDASRSQAKGLARESADLRTFLRRFYAAAIDIYLSHESVALGCYSIGTATTQAVADPEVRHFLSESIRGSDAFLANLFRKAKARAEIASSANPAALASLATAALHTLAIRARAGLDRPALQEIANSAVEVLAATPKGARHQ
jgi:AcrR family transcriptional regulator